MTVLKNPFQPPINADKNQANFIVFNPRSWP